MKNDFHKWYEKILEWDIDGCSYDDIAVCPTEMQQWYKYMLTLFPAMNGRDSKSSIEEYSKANGIGPDEAIDMSADYSISPDLIYVAFGFSQAENAYNMALAKAKELGLGFYDPQNDELDAELKKETPCKKKINYKRQVLKAIKDYLKNYGFKWEDDIFIYPSDSDVKWYLGLSMETNFRPHYFYVGPGVIIGAHSLDQIVYDVTDGIIDIRNTSVGPIRQVTADGAYDEFGTEFLGERSMEENMELFKKEFETRIWPVFERFTHAKDIYTALAHNEQNLFKVPYWYKYLYPLACFFEGRFDEAFKYIDDLIANWHKAYEEEKSMHYAPCFLDYIDQFETYKKNLKKWIAERRTFEVDSVVMPDYAKIEGL